MRRNRHVTRQNLKLLIAVVFLVLVVGMTLLAATIDPSSDRSGATDAQTIPTRRQ